MIFDYIFPYIYVVTFKNVKSPWECFSSFNKQYFGLST